MKRFFFYRTVSPHWLVALRIGIGAILLFAHVAQLPDLQQLYGPAPLVGHELLVVAEEAPAVLSYQPWLHTYGYLALCLLLCMGIGTRIAAALLLWQHTSLYTALPQLSYGFDYFCVNALFYSLVFPTGRRSSSRWVTPALRVLQLHLCIVYFFAGLIKSAGPTWRNGEALWKAYQLPVFTGWAHGELSWLGHYPLFWAAVGWAVIVLETAYPVCIWIARIRPYWLLAIIGLHAGIAVFMGLYEFSAMMILLNLCAFQLPYQPIATHRRGFVSPLPALRAIFRKEG